VVTGAGVLCLWLVEEIITALWRIRWLFVQMMGDCQRRRLDTIANQSTLTNAFDD
jgi:hypothetical protein